MRTSPRVSHSQETCHFMKTRLFTAWCTMVPVPRVAPRMCYPFAHNLCALQAAFRALTLKRAILGEGKVVCLLSKACIAWMIPLRRSAQWYVTWTRSFLRETRVPVDPKLSSIFPRQNYSNTWCFDLVIKCMYVRSPSRSLLPVWKA